MANSTLSDDNSLGRVRIIIASLLHPCLAFRSPAAREGAGRGRRGPRLIPYVGQSRGYLKATARSRGARAPANGKHSSCLRPRSICHLSDPIFLLSNEIGANSASSNTLPEMFGEVGKFLTIFLRHERWSRRREAFARRVRPGTRVFLRRLFLFDTRAGRRARALAETAAIGAEGAEASGRRRRRGAAYLIIQRKNLSAREVPPAAAGGAPATAEVGADPADTRRTSNGRLSRTTRGRHGRGRVDCRFRCAPRPGGCSRAVNVDVDTGSRSVQTVAVRSRRVWAGVALTCPRLAAGGAGGSAMAGGRPAPVAGAPCPALLPSAAGGGGRGRGDGGSLGAGERRCVAAGRARLAHRPGRVRAAHRAPCRTPPALNARASNLYAWAGGGRG
ncbi:hypothetical protein EVAR_62229_1 [Eumeta japonica]|uniref:Uncharacterized protein n=1 Tax=Eumeta variegata TaxID=151549 RepID=A0A4C1ZI22_EUMVA|nr:hypothetical protein EVAR_62229_1 [Eumeta japonica]